MKDFRGPLPLSDDDFAQIRRNVLAEVAKRRMSPLWLALPIAAAIALAFVLWPAKETAVRVAAVPVRTQPARRSTQHAALSTQHSIRVAQARTPARQPARRRRSEPMRIELQTADPNIRIIWIVQ